VLKHLGDTPRHQADETRALRDACPGETC